MATEPNIFLPMLIVAGALFAVMGRLVLNAPKNFDWEYGVMIGWLAVGVITTLAFGVMA